MKSLVSFAALLAVSLAQGVFEPNGFDAEAALLSKGVDLSDMPSFAKRSTESCPAACMILRHHFGNQTVVEASDAAYASFPQSYWSAQQRSIRPECIVKPNNAQDLSVVLLVSRHTGCPFAAKSGGHSAVPGGSAMQNGITISLEKMNQVVLSADKKSVTFGPGQTWRDVYAKLEKDNVTIIGGRAASVGVGGLTLGGGISYFSNEYGLACDNVISFEVVTACGNVVTASKSSYPDLYWALRGGGNNFGIVTKFHVVAIARDSVMWGTSRIYTSRTFPALINAYYNAGMNSAKDGKAHQILSFGWGGDQIGPLGIAQLEYADKVDNASIFAEYNAISRQEAVQYNSSFATLVQLTNALDQLTTISGLRQGYWSWTTKLNREQATVTKDIFFDELRSITNLTGVVATIAFQVISEPMIEKTAQNGGNPLGLDPKSGPLMLCLVGVRWPDSRNDAAVDTFGANVLRRSVAAAEAGNRASRYRYMNYGNKWQDIIASYGPENKARLLQISQKYDPTAVFQKLQPGYFKLNGAPSGRVSESFAM